MKKTLVMALASALLLSGCAAAFVAAGAATAAVVADKRSTGTVVDDTTLALRAESAIGNHDALRSNARIRVTAFNGNLLAVGQAPSNELRAEVERVLTDLNNYNVLFNEVRIAKPISAGQATNDTWISTKLRSEIIATKGLSVNALNITVENGEVFIMGLVSQQQAERIVDIARHVEGVRGVVRVFDYTE